MFTYVMNYAVSTSQANVFYNDCSSHFEDSKSTFCNIHSYVNCLHTLMNTLL